MDFLGKIQELDSAAKLQTINVYDCGYIEPL